MQYIVVDNNKLGLSLLNDKVLGRNIKTYECNLLSDSPNIQADMVFSVGLIEHFDSAGTAKVVRAHFDCLKPGGIAIISYPTPTLLYKMIRNIAEFLGIWSFPDERPLKFCETGPLFEKYGKVLEKKIMYPILLTQQIVVIKKT